LYNVIKYIIIDGPIQARRRYNEKLEGSGINPFRQPLPQTPCVPMFLRFSDRWFSDHKPNFPEPSKTNSTARLFFLVYPLTTNPLTPPTAQSLGYGSQMEHVVGLAVTAAGLRAGLL
jgi:hypothetical protein